MGRSLHVLFLLKKDKKLKSAIKLFYEIILF